MSYFCKYSNIFGSPQTGFHSARIGPFALWDIIGTFVLAYFVAQWGRLQYGTALLYTFVGGEFLHWLFCVDTPIIAWLRGLFT